jgi:hypothetical protein
VGNYQPTLGLWEGPGKIQWMAAVDEIKLQNAGASVVQLDRAFYRAAWRQVAANPLKAAELALRKCGRFWFVSAARRELVASVVIQSLYLALGVLGLWRSRPWRAEHGLMLAMILYVMALHAISYADSRYSPNVMPFVCMFAAAAFQRHERRTAASLSAAAASE